MYDARGFREVLQDASIEILQKVAKEDMFSVVMRNEARTLRETWKSGL